jgi:hypothetical protein
MSRTKGSKNKRKALSALELEAMKAADPRAFLQEAMNNQALDYAQRMDAAKALLPYHHSKRAPVAPLGEGEKLVDAVIVKYV